mmetsp:Transcript_12792/g.43312  ORF Transcript_12792/g.43312 Transcript_12792/m.43312 type:complete len:242 (+) Transcript_12792:3-728(+)
MIDAGAAQTAPVTPSPSGGVAVEEVAKYAFATGAQFALVVLFFRLLDLLPLAQAPAWAVAPVFTFLSLRSRVFSCLDNRRPDRAAQGGAATPAEVKRPAWTPPGKVFPIIWSTITVLRSMAGALAWEASGKSFLSPPILALALHLCVGDTWNTVTNVERRLGTSFALVLLVLASVYYAVWRMYLAEPLAGFVLAPSAAWISVATVLTGAIWRHNTPCQPLWPVRGDGKASAMRLPFTSWNR